MTCFWRKSVQIGHALDWRTEVLNGLRRCRDDRSVRLAHADERNLRTFVGSVVSKNELSELLDAGLTLCLQPKVSVAPSRPILLDRIAVRAWSMTTASWE